MKCGSCAFESPAGFKFCGACGTPFAAAAPGAPAAAREPEPGVRRPTPTPPPSPMPTGDERRTVTILFADISGFTAMSEKLDPEVVQEIMDRAFERLTAVITGFGGTIDKYIGDAVMALFGAPVALGDDPERAVRAGLGMQKVMAEYAAELQRVRGIGLAMRVGINTGKVIWGRVGGAGEKKFTVMGDAVNLASRLEHAAPIGGVLIGESTQRHVRTRFSLEALEPILVKGKAEPQRVYRVLGEVSAPARATMVGPRTPFVGRDEEMAEMTGYLAAIKTGGVGTVVTIESPVGTGKSRMVLELRAEAEDKGIATLSARAAAFGQGAPFAPWGDLVGRAASLGTLPAAAARERIRAWIEETAPGAGLDARWIDELAGEADAADPEVQRRREQPARFRQGLLDTLITWLWAASKRQPVLVLAEDIHWWPAPSLELLAGAAQVAHKAPFMVLATKRPEPTAAPWPPDAKDRVIALGPLDDAALMTMAHGVLGSEVPRGLLHRLQSLTGGNPFFAEEVIQAFIDRGALKTSPERAGWVWDEARAKQVDLPTTVEGVTQARIDALPPRERHVLQMAAVAGRTFWQGLIESMGEPDAGSSLAQLAARDLVHARRSRLAGEKEYAFKHAIIRDVAYENALKRERIGDHRRVAEWLESRAGDEGGEFATTIAEHFLLAEEQKRALPFVLRAAEEEARVTGLEQATMVRQAVEIAEATSTQLLRALRLRGRLRRIANHAGAEEDLIRAMSLAEKEGQPLIAAEVGVELAGVMIQRGSLAEAESYARKTLSAAQAAGATRSEARALNLLGIVARWNGEHDVAMGFYERAFRLAEALGDDSLVGAYLTSIGNLHMTSSRYSEALAAFERALPMKFSRETAAILRSNLGAAQLALGHLDAARATLNEASDLATAIGLRWVIAETMIRRGAVEDAAGAAGLGLIEDGLALARAADAAEQVLEALWRRALIVARSDVASARKALSEARALAEAKMNRDFLAKILAAEEQLATNKTAS